MPSGGYTASHYNQAWGACPDGDDLEILTLDSIAAAIFRNENDAESRPRIASIDLNWMNRNTFTLGDHLRTIVKLDLPGFLGQDQTPLAILVFHTQWTLPYRWIEQVINDEYERGLIFHMQSYDIGANAEMWIPDSSGDFTGECSRDHVYTSAPDSIHIQSGHCAGQRRLIRAIDHVTFDMLNDGDGGEDCDLPPIDDDGNEVNETVGEVRETQ